MNKLCGTIDNDFIIASDTDSVYLKLNKLIEIKCKDLSHTQKVDFCDKFSSKIITPFIDASYEELKDYMRCNENMMNMKREMIADKVFWKAKKKYVANVIDNESIRYKEPKMKIMGLESVSSKFPEHISNYLEETYKLIVNTDVNKLDTILLAHMDNVKAKFYKLAPEEISFSSSVNGMDKYGDKNGIYKKGTPINTRAALLYNHYIVKNNLQDKYPLIKGGSKIKYVYLKTPNNIREDVIAYITSFPKEIVPVSYIDYHTQYTKCYENSVTELLKILGISTSATLW